MKSDVRAQVKKRIRRIAGQIAGIERMIDRDRYCVDVLHHKQLTLPDAKGFESRTGRGVVGEVAGRRVAIGNRKLLEEVSVNVGALDEVANGMRAEAQTVMFVAVDAVLAGLVGVADPIKASTPDAVRGLREEGLRVVVLTGDNRTTAEAVAKRLGLDEVLADVCRTRRQRSSANCRPKGASWRWPATG